jgi:hypothetical protein
MVRRGGIEEGRAEFLARYLNPLPASSKDIHLRDMCTFRFLGYKVTQFCFRELHYNYKK